MGFLLAMDELLHEDGEIGFVCDPSRAETRELIRPVHEAFLPGTVLALLNPDEPAAAAEAIKSRRENLVLSEC